MYTIVGTEVFDWITLPWSMEQVRRMASTNSTSWQGNHITIAVSFIIQQQLLIWPFF